MTIPYTNIISGDRNDTAKNNVHVESVGNDIDTSNDVSDNINVKNWNDNKNNSNDKHDLNSFDGVTWGHKMCKFHKHRNISNSDGCRALVVSVCVSLIKNDITKNGIL